MDGNYAEYAMERMHKVYKRASQKPPIHSTRCRLVYVNGIIRYMNCIICIFGDRTYWAMACGRFAPNALRCKPLPNNELTNNYTIINVFFYFFNFSRAAQQARRITRLRKSWICGYRGNIVTLRRFLRKHIITHELSINALMV